MEYSQDYVNSTATNEFFYLDANRHAEERSAEANYNKGFAARKTLLGVSADVTTEITLNGYSFFEALRDELLPSTRLEINLQIESDNNLIWQAGAAFRVMIMRMQLVVPRITFNSEGLSLYIDQFMKPHKWSYLRENIERSNSTRLRSGTFTISTGIERPRHVLCSSSMMPILVHKRLILSCTTHSMLLMIEHYHLPIWLLQMVMNILMYTTTHQLI